MASWNDTFWCLQGVEKMPLISGVDQGRTGRLQYIILTCVPTAPLLGIITYKLGGLYKVQYRWCAEDLGLSEEGDYQHILCESLIKTI